MRDEGLLSAVAESSPPAHEGPASELASVPPDLVLRRRVFWTVLTLALGFVAASQGLERWMSYPLNRPSGSASRGPRPGTIRHGSYGFPLARYAFAPGFRSVVLLGNSVYQSRRFPRYMQQLADRERRRLAIYDLAQTGAGIHDIVVQSAAVLPRHPDLLVVSVFGLSFTSDFEEAGSLPRFRTDADQMVFDPAPARALPWSFVRRELDHASMADALLSTVLPAKRLDTPLRVAIGNTLGLAMPGHSASPLLAQFAWPQLNIAADWLERAKGPARSEADLHPRPYPETEQILEELVGMAARYDVRLLVIWQEAGPRFAEPDARPALARACAR